MGVLFVQTTYAKIGIVESMKIPTKIKNYVLKQPRRVLVLVGILFIVLGFGGGLVLFTPKLMHYAYAKEACSPLFTLLPATQKPSSEHFELALKGELRIGDFVYASTQVCVTPTRAPEPGTYTAAITPFGGVGLGKPVTITVPEQPVVRAADIVGKDISTALPLKVPLSVADTIHSYNLAASDTATTAPCQYNESDLSCDVSKLALEQGREYTLSLYRSFKTDEKKKVLEGSVKTLTPIKQLAATIENNATIYDMPKSFTFEYDQEIASSEVTLEKIEADAKTPIPTTIQQQGKKLTVSLADDLARTSQYILTIQQVIATTGNSLEQPTVIPFSTSAGPKVKSVSVGSGAVQPTAAIIVTLDQPIADDVVVGSVARVKGVSGTVSKRSATELVFNLNTQGCQPFSLVIDKGVKSATNNEVSEAWNFDSRTICGTSSIIGYSVKGRPILAYSFGNGSTTILFTAGIHGSEPSSTTTLQAWVNYLQVNGYTIPSNKRLVIVPSVNPDGLAAGTRNNSRNVNLDRNFPSANWSASIETSSGVLPTGGGTSPGSEPEAAALLSLTRQLRPRLAVSFHAQGRLVGANKVADSVSIGNIYAGTVGYATMYDNAEAVMGYTITGEYEDWMGEELGVPAILIELPTLSGNYLSSQQVALWKMVTL